LSTIDTVPSDTDDPNNITLGVGGFNHGLHAAFLAKTVSPKAIGN